MTMEPLIKNDDDDNEEEDDDDEAKTEEEAQKDILTQSLKEPLEDIQEDAAEQPKEQRQPEGRHVRKISLEESSPHKPRSLIGSVFRLSRSEGGEPNIHTISVAHRSMHEPPPGEEIDTTWGEVCQACCIHSGMEWLHISRYIGALLFLLYFFLVGLDLLGTAFKVVGGCTAGSLLASDTNPLTGVLIGIVATTLLQSSSTTTAIIVSLVSGGLDVQQGIYMIMGANIGTAVTGMLVSLAHTGDGEELERAFAGSSVLYIFNFLTVVVLLPIEIATNYLYYLTKAMLPSSVGEGDSWEGPIKKIVSPLVKTVIIANKQLIDDISTGAVESCSASGIYPVECDEVESYQTCPTPGVIGCDEDSGDCPLFFQDGATKRDDMVSGWVCMIIALCILVLCLIGLVSLLRKLLLGASTKIIYKATNINPYLAMLIGCGVTVLVQSSSITTSTLVPLAGMGILDLEHMYPLVLGADIGTTFTALMAALVSSNVQALQIALVHFFFNVTGIIIWYPIPFMRHFVLRIAELLGKATGKWRGFPILFIVMMFFLFPLLLIGISSCFEQGTIGFSALGSFLLVLIFGAILYFSLWWYCQGGRSRCSSCVNRRQRRAAAIQALADDMDYLKVDQEWCKNEIGRIKDFAGHIQQASVRMEEGVPLVSIAGLTDMPGATAGDEDERLSMYESCRSRPWKDILFLASGSIRSGLQGSTHTRPELQGSVHTRRSDGMHALGQQRSALSGLHVSIDAKSDMHK